MKRVYIASAITTGDQARNVRAGLDAADRLLSAGFAPFSPVLTWFWHMVHPHPWEQWLALDEAWLACCDYLVRLPGESAGADREVDFARVRGIPVYHGVEAFLDAVGP